MSSEELFHQFDWRVTLDTAPLPDGRIKKSVRVHRCDSVHVLPFLTEDTVLLIREFRPFYQEYIWMLPSGKADKETDILVAAQRELREETGYKAGSIEPFGKVNQSDTITITNHLFLARDLTRSPLPQDHDELISVESMTVQEAIGKVLTSPRVHTPSGFLLLQYAREHGL